ncbi:VOC family protein [Ilumatobacter nonamiensis]|uniref:VOC family protein n=1 Tax=Ilumatobacter nonamiensis TaxID=467093 RepID=UPI00034774DC|nr:VOC family protein [Ilumatobacter nonamiensis]
MATVTRYRHGVPNWTDVGVADTAACVSFYESLFGWGAEDQGEDAGGYHMFRLDGAAVAGLGPKQNDDGMPLWSAYISVDDIDAALSRAEAAGATVVMPRTDVFTSGSMAIVVDPTGAVVSFWQPGDHIGAERVNVANTLSWHELTTRDPQGAMDFYGSVLGWEFQEMPGGADDDPSGGMPGYRMVMVGDRVVGGIMPMEGDDWGDMPSHWMIYFAVDDTDAAATRVGELGGAVSVPPFDIPVGRISVCNDPDGNAFSIIAFAGPIDTIDDGVA